MPSLRILMISALEVWALSGQGGAPSLYRTLEGYSRRGHHVDFVSSTIGANHHFRAPKQHPPTIDGVTFHLFDLPSLGESRLPLPGIMRKADQKMRFAALFPMLAARAAERLFREQDYDLLYGYEVHGVLAQRRVRSKHALPLIARFQGTVMAPYLRRPHSLARKYEEVLALKTPAEMYIMTDDGTQGDEVLQRLNPGSAGRVCFWRNGLDMGVVRPPEEGEVAAARKRLGLKDEDFVLVTASRLARWKRVDRAVDAVALLRDQGIAARLLIVGDGEERTNLQEQTRNLGLQDRVTFVGAVPQADVQNYLWASDVFLSVNELSNVGNPLLEAMIAGRCVLTLDEGDTRDLVRDGETGILLQSGEPENIARSLETLARDATLRRRLGLAAQRLADRSFWSWEQRMDAEVDAVEALIEASTPRGVRPRSVDD
ncbi:MAG TPA: glycosyltransferase family 4 protein [Dehalococcoidia bacterium]|nr:glycosyltransferase family 4 protein [Dehalococcoidia bacterium]